MYSNMKSCVTLNQFNSDYCRISIGLMQGEVISPILFSLYVNDFFLNQIVNHLILVN